MPPRKRKAQHACVFCRRSHMTCDDSRPCARCIKRNIGHLCRDEFPNKSNLTTRSCSKNLNNENLNNENLNNENLNNDTCSIINSSSEINNDIFNTTIPYFENTTSEISSLNEFASMLDETAPWSEVPEKLNNINNFSTNNDNTTTSDNLLSNSLTINTQNISSNESTNENLINNNNSNINNICTSQDKKLDLNIIPLSDSSISTSQTCQISDKILNTEISNTNTNTNTNNTKHLNSIPNNSTTKEEKFFLTAADPVGTSDLELSPEARLRQVINAKLEAGLLKPFNYVGGYTRLQSYMESHMSPQSRKRILKTLSSFRPAFRSIAQSLTDLDLVLVEESFERTLLDYDRIFSSMAIPACLWRRTGEIFRGNKEFAALVNVHIDSLRNGNLAIYELMSEDSAMNYWEKYGNIAFDPGHKAVLTSCTLKSPTGSICRACFSFTIRRDKYNIPVCIVGNFIPLDPPNN